MSRAIKTFEVEEGWTRRGNYRITVKSNQKIISVFSKKTKAEALRAFHRAGYQLVAWAEDNKIVCQKEKIQIPKWDLPPGFDPDDKRSYLFR